MNGEWGQLSFRVVVKNECQGMGVYDSELDGYQYDVDIMKESL